MPVNYGERDYHRYYQGRLGNSFTVDPQIYGYFAFVTMSLQIIMERMRGQNAHTDL